MPERRQVVRHEAHIRVNCRAPSTFLFAHITDISELGVFVATPDPPAVGVHVELGFRGPEDTAGKSHEFVVRGEVMWRNTDDASGHTGMGVRFTGLEQETQLALHDLIEKVAFLGEA